ncbi:hypothetical protein F5Y16DRAFT_419881 [Xylariaceae sp. FL0255]|nr:hypothetical protein F5Y16DRAFT_419881 [Xylariaceae sp. FL0255]
MTTPQSPRQRDAGANAGTPPSDGGRMANKHFRDYRRVLSRGSPAEAAAVKMDLQEKYGYSPDFFKYGPKKSDSISLSSDSLRRITIPFNYRTISFITDDRGNGNDGDNKSDFSSGVKDRDDASTAHSSNDNGLEIRPSRIRPSERTRNTTLGKSHTIKCTLGTPLIPSGGSGDENPSTEYESEHEHEFKQKGKGNGRHNSPRPLDYNGTSGYGWVKSTQMNDFPGNSKNTATTSRLGGRKNGPTIDGVLNAKVAQLEGKMDYLELSIEFLNASLKDLTAMAIRLETKVNDLDRTVERLDASLDKTAELETVDYQERKITQLTDSLNDTAERVAQLEGTADLQERGFKQLSDNLAGMAGRVTPQEHHKLSRPTLSPSPISEFDKLTRDIMAKQKLYGDETVNAKKQQGSVYAEITTTKTKPGDSTAAAPDNNNKLSMTLPYRPQQQKQQEENSNEEAQRKSRCKSSLHGDQNQKQQQHQVGLESSPPITPFPPIVLGLLPSVPTSTSGPTASNLNTESEKHERIKHLARSLTQRLANLEKDSKSHWPGNLTEIGSYRQMIHRGADDMRELTLLLDL